MGTKIKVMAFIVGCLFFLMVAVFVRKKSFNPAFSVLWLLVSFFLVSISIFEPLYRWVATSVIGIVDARHVIYIVLIGFLLGYVFYLSLRISRMSDQIQNLISHSAIHKKTKDDEK